MVSRVFLVGFMGCGKSTIGRHLAKDLGWEFIDMDDYIEQQQGCTIKQIFADKGEAAFRQIETTVIEELGQKDNVVIATGGGAPCFGQNAEIMRRSGLMLFISVEPVDLVKRLSKAKANRPLLADKSDAELLQYVTDKLTERMPSYRRAHMIVDGEKWPFSAYASLVSMFPEESLND